MITFAEIEAALPSLQPAEVERLETLVREVREQADEERREKVYERLGFRPFPKRGGPAATTELVRQICEEEGV